MCSFLGLSRAFGRIAKQHRFTTTSKVENKVKDLSQRAKTAREGKNKNVVYNILCGCGQYSYTGETSHKWETRKKEHMDNVRLTRTYINNDYRTRGEDNTTEVFGRYHQIIFYILWYHDIEGKKQGDNSPQLV